MGDETAPYGSWPSPLSPADVAGGGVSVDGVAIDGDDVWWLERRPDEDGRGVLVRQSGDGDPEDVTPANYDVRTLVHEYGGGDFLVADGTVWFSNRSDQRLYRQDPGTIPDPVSVEPPAETAHRYADADLTPDGDRLYCVRERHDVEGEPVNELVTLPARGGPETVVASGHDFYSFPRVSPDGTRLAWTAWDHPAMPWDETTLFVARIEDDGTLTDEEAVLGGDGESVFQPRWRPDGVLHAVSDRTGWWNLYRLADGTATNLCEMAAEFGTPQWVFGLSTYAFLDDGRLVAAYGRESRERLALVDDGDVDEFDLPYDAFPRHQIRADGDTLAFVAGGPTTPPTVVRFRPGSAPEELRRSVEVSLDPAYVSEPDHVAFPTTDGETAHAEFYPPQNPAVSEPDDELPPLVVSVHGGPTSERHPVLSVTSSSGQPPVQFWTTRGVAVADVNYRGSTGYGREYRDRLQGEWGEADVADCVACAAHLADEGRVDPDRLAIAGGSAGGYATLRALTAHDTFDAGVSYYGVADLQSLAEMTHKFESRYLDGLVGPLPEAEDRYRERSPVHHADEISASLLLLQGSDDPVVPVDQAEAMLDALAETGVPHGYVEFEGERHGFRRAESIERCAEAEISFYGQVFGFDPADDVDPVDLRSD